MQTMQANPDKQGRPLAELLRNRYGDGQIYLPKSMSSGVLRDAVDQGFVSEEGYLTRKGRNFLAHAR
jgi:hypothetical protein